MAQEAATSTLRPCSLVRAEHCREHSFPVPVVDVAEEFGKVTLLCCVEVARAGGLGAVGDVLSGEPKGEVIMRQ